MCRVLGLILNLSCLLLLTMVAVVSPRWRDVQYLIP